MNEYYIFAVTDDFLHNVSNSQALLQSSNKPASDVQAAVLANLSQPIIQSKLRYLSNQACIQEYKPLMIDSFSNVLLVTDMPSKTPVMAMDSLGTLLDDLYGLPYPSWLCNDGECTLSDPKNWSVTLRNFDGIRLRAMNLILVISRATYL